MLVSSVVLTLRSPRKPLTAGQISLILTFASSKFLFNCSATALSSGKVLIPTPGCGGIYTYISIIYGLIFIIVLEYYLLRRVITFLNHYNSIIARLTTNSSSSIFLMCFSSLSKRCLGDI